MTPLPNDIVDKATFDQLLEMDEDACYPYYSTACLPLTLERRFEPGFSQGLVENFFQQAEGTLKEIQVSLQQRDLNALSRQGHFLKGSAAALGIVKVKLCFEKIQYLGQGKDEFGQGTSDPNVALQRIAALISDVNRHLAEAKLAFQAFYGA
ncbi:putative histidine phosphotransferase HPT1p [Catenaria anguillulae PL171]|uniref:Putative histidine phosphotransferase HPT1p n=1 Tax=Catenaria anguillulae PL171 TaxID=765915 RepID=A0A1Y2HAM6_9FUNG|nr:putative histidine phosphotransferase HPT1p [Catenaria anguillulae PL171]